METVFDDAEGTRLNTRDDGGLEIERYVESPPTTNLTPQEAMDVAVSVIDCNAGTGFEDAVFCEDCCFHWPEDQCKKLFIRPEKTIPNFVLEPANCQIVNYGNNCGYFQPREVKDEVDES